MTACYLALGGNAGDVFGTMEQGLSLLDRVAGLRVFDVSSVYETAPIGLSLQTPFLNAACRLECELGPNALLRQLQTIEDRLGRRRETRWEPRPLDLDVLLYGDVVSSDPDLTLPHLHLWYRRFVLDPLVEIAPDLVHPILGQTIRKLRESLRQRPLPVTLIGGPPRERSSLSQQLQARFPEITVADVSAADDPVVHEPIGLVLNCDSDATDELVLTRDSDAGNSDATVENDEFPKPSTPIEPPPHRNVRLEHIPGSMLEAAESVLTAALDEPVRQSRPLRRMP